MLRLHDTHSGATSQASRPAGHWQGEMLSHCSNAITSPLVLIY